MVAQTNADIRYAQPMYRTETDTVAITMNEHNGRGKYFAIPSEYLYFVSAKRTEFARDTLSGYSLLKLLKFNSKTLEHTMISQSHFSNLQFSARSEQKAKWRNYVSPLITRLFGPINFTDSSNLSITGSLGLEDALTLATTSGERRP